MSRTFSLNLSVSILSNSRLCAIPFLIGPNSLNFAEINSAIDNHISIKDNTMDRLVTVYINTDKKELQCDFCNKTNCLHIGFCFFIQEVYKVLIELGFRPRKPKRKKSELK